MSMTADFSDHLKGAGIAGGRVYRDERNQGAALPAVVIQSIDDPISPLMKGEDALREAQIQVDVWAASRGAADDMASAILAARPLRQIVGSTNFRRIYADTISTTSERPAGQTATTYRTRLDLTVWWKPAI